MLYVGSTVLNRRIRSIVWMVIFIYSLELLVLGQYGLLPQFANSIVLLSIFRFNVALILAAIMSLLLICTYDFCRSSSKECEIGDYYYDEHELLLVALNNNRKLKTVAASAA